MKINKHTHISMYISEWHVKYDKNYTIALKPYNWTVVDFTLNPKQTLNLKWQLCGLLKIFIYQSTLWDLHVKRCSFYFEGNRVECSS